MNFPVENSKWAFWRWRNLATPASESGVGLNSPRTLSATRRLINVLGPFLGLLLVVGLFCLSPTVRPYFLTGANFKIILTQTVIVAIGTLGMTLIIVSGGIDLSVGSVVALTSVVGALALVKGYSVF